jgi:hypothetical protein
MNKPSEYVMDLFKKIREDISEIKHRLFTEKPKSESESTQPVEYSIDTVHKNPNADKETAVAQTTIVRARLNLPETINVKAETEERTKPWNQDRSYLLQIGGVGVAAIVAVIYFMQWMTMIKSVDATRQASEREQRAWVSIHSPMAFVDSKESLANMPIRIENIGKTPARRVVVDAWVELIPVDRRPDLSGRAKTEYGLPFENEKGGAPPWPADDWEYEEFLAARIYALTYVKASYDDIFNVRHWTKFCTWRTKAPSTPTAECSAINTTDTNDEP